MRILSWNVNGLRATIKKGFVDWLKNEAPDILGVQETKAHREQLPEPVTNLDHYESYFAEAERKGYSGVGLFTQCEPLSVSDSLGIPRFDREGRVLIARYPEFTLFNVYFPNGKASDERLQYKMDFYEAFLTHCEGLLDAGESVIVCGDVNTAHQPIDLARPKDNETISGFLPEERDWIDRFLAAGFVDTFRMFTAEGGHYTWWDLRTRARDRNVGWRLDYFFVSEDLKAHVRDAFILPDVYGSDHCPVGIDLDF